MTSLFNFLNIPKGYVILVVGIAVGLVSIGRRVHDANGSFNRFSINLENDFAQQTKNLGISLGLKYPTPETQSDENVQQKNTIEKECPTVLEVSETNKNKIDSSAAQRRLEQCLGSLVKLQESNKQYEIEKKNELKLVQDHDDFREPNNNNGQLRFTGCLIDNNTISKCSKYTALIT